MSVGKSREWQKERSIARIRGTDDMRNIDQWENKKALHALTHSSESDHVCVCVCVRVWGPSALSPVLPSPLLKPCCFQERWGGQGLANIWGCWGRYFSKWYHTGGRKQLHQNPAYNFSREGKIPACSASDSQCPRWLTEEGPVGTSKDRRWKMFNKFKHKYICK